ncbi:hypothetical protein [Arcobacter arenosus]|uniref:Flagellar hook-length control protein FliK n=1 Tax=Arcobacter arenosus TaxID=2576037 RepID=A0A5R8XYZ1_9BACT|nr:hypothetical protein [Arcobacter arenosus]TLP36992.1 hypothetical protein FDK22_12160 [Arcobacter arenosus]
MTKEIDFLSLSKTDTNSSSGTKSNGTEKKEGLSLFDSLLASSKEETQTKDTNVSDEKSKQNTDLSKQTTTTDTNNKNKQVQTKDEDLNNTQENKVSQNKSSEKEDSKKEVNNLPKDSKEQNLEPKTKDISSNNSLLDRMVLEANQKTKSKNLYTAETKENIVEKVDSKEQTASFEETIEKEQKKLKTSDKTNIETSKENEKVSTKEVVLEEKDEQTKNKTTKDNKPDSSLLDKLITKAKEEISSKTLENIDEPKTEKQNTSSTLKDEIVVEKQNNSSSITDEIVGKQNLSSSTPEVETEKTSSLLDKLVNEAKKEIKTNNKNVEENSSKTVGTTQTQVEINFDELEKTDSKIEEKDTKTKLETENKVKTTKNVQLEDESLSDTKKVEKDITLTKKENIETVVSKEDTKVNNSNKEEIKAEINNAKVVNKVSEETDSSVEKNTTQQSTTASQSTSQTSSGTTQNKLSDLEKEALNTKDETVNLKKDDIAKLNESSNKEENVKVESSKQESKSLMDRLFDNAKAQTISAKNPNLQESDFTKQGTLNKNNNDIATNIYLSSQKNSIYNQMLSNKTEGVKTVKDGTSIEDVKKGADILNLNLEDASVEIDESSTKAEPQSNNKANLDSKISLLDKLAFNKNLNVEELLKRAAENLESQKIASNSITNSSSSNSSISSTNETQTVNLNVNPNLAMTIQNRIIGAQQQMSSMMSDVARNMYENYKPPVTAFRLNLFPAQLGHIAILMKTDRENAISISMSLSQSSTHDAFVENQSMLRDALNRNFNNPQTTISLDFNMQNESSNNQSSNEQNSNNENTPQSHSSDEVIESIIQNKDATEDLNYM